MKNLLVALIALFVLSVPAQAACSGGSCTRTEKSKAVSLVKKLADKAKKVVVVVLNTAVDTVEGVAGVAMTSTEELMSGLDLRQ